ncbi:MAG: hypothetical protein AAFO02_26225, partial [Bacteroidota bacterium]
GKNLSGKGVSHFGVPKRGIDDAGNPLNDFNLAIDKHLQTDPADLYLIDIKNFGKEAKDSAKEYIKQNYSNLYH